MSGPTSTLAPAIWSSSFLFDNTGYLSNFDISKYMLHEYTAEQMKQLRLGLEAGIDITKYNMIGFSSGADGTDKTWT